MYTVKSKAKEINRLSYKFVKCRTVYSPRKIIIMLLFNEPPGHSCPGFGARAGERDGAGTETGDPQDQLSGRRAGKAGVRDMVGDPQHVIRWALRVGPGSAKR